MHVHVQMVVRRKTLFLDYGFMLSLHNKIINRLQYI